MLHIDMQEAESFSQLDHPGWDLALVGQPVDTRGTAAIEALKLCTGGQAVATYDPNLFTLSVDGEPCPAERCSSLLLPFVGRRIVLEATTLGFVEIYLCAKHLRAAGSNSISLLYVEPRDYTRTSGEPLLKRRDFELSTEVPGFRGIPGATLVTGGNSKQRTVFFLGFEERRLDVAMQTQPIEASETHVVFGVPAFAPGWEMHSFANNVRVIQDSGIRGGVHFCGAENPLATVGLLNEIKSSLSAEERLILSPIGTKPCGMGVALFAATNEHTGLLYDHPKKSVKRTVSMTRWHLYDVEF